MSQRESGYERKENDLYETPAWVTECLRPHVGNLQTIWEPACGSGAMVKVFLSSWRVPYIESTDIANGYDFLKQSRSACEAIITNPPYSQSQAFIEHALKLALPHQGLVAMLLRTDYDHAKTRQHLFGKCPWFAKKVVLTKRIVWFERDGAAPSFNHAWYIWDYKHQGAPTLAYAP